jgi:leucyl aminopeptidase
MDYSVKTEPLHQLITDCIILGFHQKRQLLPQASILDEALGGLLVNLLKRDEIEGKIGDILLINHLPNSGCERVLLVGLGKKDELRPAGFRKALGVAAKALQDSGAKQAVSLLHEAMMDGYDLSWKIRQNIEIFESVVYKFTGVKRAEEEKPRRWSKLQFLLDDNEQMVLAKQSIKQGLAIVNGMNLARNLGNLPGNLCTPTYLAEQAEQLAKHRRMKIKVLSESDLEELGMGAFLSVTKGSEQPAKLIILEYFGTKSKTKPYVLIGKGLTFDAGGISLKPAASMDEMKFDMCGGASVIGTLSAVAELELPLNAVGLIPASENLPDGRANKPGDVVTTLSGLTVEILNTDAEGRLLLCDTLSYAKRYEPQAVIDVATLTGACVVALGRHPSGLMSHHEELVEELVRAGEMSWDRVWRLPIWEDYEEQLKSNFADLANIGGPEGGSVTAACFLSRFAKDFPWAHVDIAGTAWKTGNEKGATGRPVPLLVQYLIDRVHDTH